MLYLDSDNTPCGSLEGPDSIFESDGFKSTGAMFWPDYWKGAILTLAFCAETALTVSYG